MSDVLETGASDLQERIAHTPSDRFRAMMNALGVADDIAERVAALDFSDRGNVQEAHLSCFGRLQHMQTAGRFVAELLHRRFRLAREPGRDMRQLDWDGGILSPSLLTEAQAADTRSFLSTRPVYNGHTPEASTDGVGRHVGDTAEQFPFGSHRFADIVAAPRLLEAALSDEIIAMAASHLGCTPTLSGLQAWWNFSEHRNNRVADATGSLTGYSPQHFHRDLNDFRMFWVYMYLTDVDEACGPHQVVKGSGDYRNIERRLGASPTGVDVGHFFYQYGYQLPANAVETLFADAVTTLTGAAGTTFLSNGFNFHRVRYPLVKPRLMFAARFSIYPPPPAEPTRQAAIPCSVIEHRIGDSPTMRHVTRNVVDWR